MDESILVGKLKSGDRAGFQVLISQFSDRVINTCYRFLLDKEDAEDLSQEVFIEVFKSIHSFRGEASLATWIYRIAVTKSLDEIKRRKRKKRVSSLGSLLHLDDVANWFPSTSRSDGSLVEADEMKEIKTALDKLPDNQRVAFTLSKIEGYTNKEIAEIMNTTTVAVESLVYRARKKVLHELERILKN